MSASDVEVVEQDPTYDGAVAEATQFLVDYWRSKYPTIDLQPARAVFDLLVRPSAEAQAFAQTNLNRYRLASSLEAIRQDPTLVPPGDVDAILGNFLVSRKAGTTSSGTITIVLDADRVVSVPQGSIFEGNGLQFISLSTYISTSGDLNTPYDRPLVQLEDGNWAFTIVVQASAPGPTYQLRRGTEVTWGLPAAGYIRSYAEADFTPATDPETNTQLINRFDSGIASDVMAGRINIEGLLQTNFPAITAMSEIGNGDSEMLRDSHNIFGIKTGGKVDIYGRTSTELVSQVFTLECMVVDTADKILQVSIGRDVYPGFYFINSIQPADANNMAGTLEIIQDSRGVDLTDLTYVAPAIISIIEGAYSRYQTSVVQFRDPALLGTAAIGDKFDYKFEIAGLPLVADVQDYVANRGVRGPAADYLYRAPIPLLVSVSMQIDYYKGDEAVNVSQIKTDVSNAINQIDFSRGHLPASLIIDTAHNSLTGRSTVHTPIDIMAVLRLPSGATRVYRSSTSIDIPDIPEEGASSRNILFFTDVSAIEANVVTVAVKSV